MKVRVKFIITFLFAPLIFLNFLTPVNGLSKFIHEYYKVDDDYGILVYYYYKSPPEEYDYISIFTYKENPKYNLMTSFCRSRYTLEGKKVIFYDREVYLQDNYIFSNSNIFDLKDGEIVIEVNTRVGDTEINPLVYANLLELNLSNEEAKDFNYEYIVNSYDRLDINRDEAPLVALVIFAGVILIRLLIIIAIPIGIFFLLKFIIRFTARRIKASDKKGVRKK